MPPEYERDDYISYCCIEGCVEDHNNINDEPGFVLTFDTDYPMAVVNPYHYHLSFDSVCKDAGNPVYDANDFGLYDMDGEDRVVDSYIDIGADEIYSCDDDLSEDDIYNEMDWNFDGLVNYAEFAEFADVWLIRDPNDPGIITDPNFSDDPDYASPETLAMWIEKWDSFYNLDDEGTSEYMIDVYDLVVIANDWAWAACWKQSQLNLFENIIMEMMMGGGSEDIMFATELAQLSSFTVFDPVPVERTTAELVSFVEGIYGIIEYVDSVEETHENAENLYDIKAFLEEVLKEMQAGL